MKSFLEFICELDESFLKDWTQPLDGLKRRPDGFKTLSPDQLKQFDSSVSEEIYRNIRSVAHHKSLNRKDNESGLLEALKSYTATSHPINSKLLNNQEHGDVPDIDLVLNNKENALKGDVVAYSGVGAEMGKKLMEHKMGDFVHFPAYTSTSLDYQIAHSFGGSTPTKLTDGEDEEIARHIAVFHLPEGYHQGRYIESHSRNQGEEEYTLARDQKFKYNERRIFPHRYNGIQVFHHFTP